MSTFKVGDRVQTHPATDAWMQGDRYGEIVASQEFPEGAWHRVKMDKSGRSIWFHAKNLQPIEE